MTQTQTDNAWSDIGEAEQRARDAAVARARQDDFALSTLIRTRRRDIEHDPPIIDHQRAQASLRSARTRQAWAGWHRAQAERHRATLTNLIARHGAAAERLSERLAGGGGGS